MRYVWLVALSCVGCGLSSPDEDGSGDPTTPGGCPTTPSSTAGGAELECRMLELVNQTRAQGTTCNGVAMPGVPALGMHPTLRQVARGHAEDMAVNDYFSHEDPEGIGPFDRMKQAGYEYSSAAENIAAGHASAEETLQQWLTSPTGHCENVMDGGFVHIGVGYAFSAQNKYGHLWVQNFGAPL